MSAVEMQEINNNTVDVFKKRAFSKYFYHFKFIFFSSFYYVTIWLGKHC